MARPRKQAQEQRTKKINIRVSEEEDRQMAARAKAARCSLPAYAVQQLICGPVQRTHTDVLPVPVVLQLMRIGVNLRQLLALPEAAGIHEAAGDLSDRLSAMIEAAIDADPGREDDAWERPRMRCIRVTEEQHRVILALAAQSGKPLSDYAREMLTRGRVLVRQVSEKDFPHIEELRALGEALNAKTRAANSERRMPSDVPLLAARIHQILDAAGLG